MNIEDIKTVKEFEQAKHDKAGMLAYYGITEDEFESVTPDMYSKIGKPVDNHKYTDLKRQLWHDYRAQLWLIYEASQPKTLKVSTVRKEILKNKSELSSSELRFVDGLKGKRKLTVKQESWIRGICTKVEVALDGEFENRLSKDEKLSGGCGTKPSHCSHEDLGSLGYIHGQTVKCPFCGEWAEVW